MSNPVDVAIGSGQVYVVDNGLLPNDGVGFVYRLNAAGSPLIDQPLVAPPTWEPVGITIDPLNQQLLVLDSFGDRLVRVNPGTGNVSEVFTGFSIPFDGDGDGLEAGWGGVDITPGGDRLVITDRNRNYIYIFGRDIE